MRAVDADEIAAGLDGAPRRVAEALHDVADVGHGHRVRDERRRAHVRHRRRRPGLQAADLGVDDAAAEVQLGPDARAVLLHREHQLAQLRDQVVVVQAHLQPAALAARVDVGRLGVHEADTAAGARHEVVDVDLRDASFQRAVVALHRRGDDAVADFHRADAAGAEEMREAHGGPLSWSARHGAAGLRDGLHWYLSRTFHGSWVKCRRAPVRRSRATVPHCRSGVSKRASGVDRRSPHVFN